MQVNVCVCGGGGIRERQTDRLRSETDRDSGTENVSYIPLSVA